MLNSKIVCLRKTTFYKGNIMKVDTKWVGTKIAIINFKNVVTILYTNFKMSTII